MKTKQLPSCTPHSGDSPVSNRRPLATAIKTALLLLAPTVAGAQAAYPGYADLDINNISARTLAHGDMWWDPSTGLARCEYPKGSGKNVGFAAGLWMAAYDDTGALHISAQTYRTDGLDFWPGPWDTSSTSFQKYANASRWAKVWSIERSALDSFFAEPVHTVFNTPSSILTWPAQGNIYARDAAGSTITINRPMAPYIDVNGDGRYHALDGDHPALIGDKMLWWITNDAGATHNAGGGGLHPLGMEINNRAYAFKRGTAVDDIIFYDYRITSHSPNHYNFLRVGFWGDLDLGGGFNDMTGFDTAHRMAYVYNGTPTDTVYGTNIPAVGISLLQLPGDAPGAPVPAGTYNFYLNDNSPFGAPQTPQGHNNLLRGRMHGGGLNPDLEQYKIPLYECNSSLPAGDKRLLLASGDEHLMPGGTTRIVAALLVAPSAGGCPNTDLSGLFERADTAWNVFTQVATGLTARRATDGFRLYPNPAQTQLTVELTANDREPVMTQVFDATGRQIQLPTTREGRTIRIDVRQLPKGVYALRLQAGTGSTSKMFVKE